MSREEQKAALTRQQVWLRPCPALLAAGSSITEHITRSNGDVFVGILDFAITDASLVEGDIAPSEAQRASPVITICRHRSCTHAAVSEPEHGCVLSACDGVEGSSLMLKVLSGPQLNVRRES